MLLRRGPVSCRCLVINGNTKTRGPDGERRGEEERAIVGRDGRVEALAGVGGVDCEVDGALLCGNPATGVCLRANAVGGEIGQ